MASHLLSSVCYTTTHGLHTMLLVSVMSHLLVTVHSLCDTYAEYDDDRKCHVNSDHNLEIHEKF